LDRGSEVVEHVRVGGAAPPQAGHGLGLAGETIHGLVGIHLNSLRIGTGKRGVVNGRISRAGRNNN